MDIHTHSNPINGYRLMTFSKHVGGNHKKWQPDMKF